MRQMSRQHTAVDEAADSRTRRANAIRVGSLILAGLVFSYLAVVAVVPEIRMRLPPTLQWFGRPNSIATLAIAVALIIVVALSSTIRSKPAKIALGLGLLSAALAGASYWHCADSNHPAFFTPLIWSLDLVTGSVATQNLDSGACPAPPRPVALPLAHLAALGAFLSAIGYAVEKLRIGTDRLRVRTAHAVTVVVDPDEDAKSLISAIQINLDARNDLVILTPDPLQPVVREARAGHPRPKVVDLDMDHPGELAKLGIWDKLDRLYLLSPQHSTNLKRMRQIDEIMVAETGKRSDAGGSDRRRIPLVVRIDDPWQAAAWRAQQLSGTMNDCRWAADAIGRYEVTALRLLDAIADERPHVTRIVICGSSPLTLALLAEAAQRQMEATFEHGADAVCPDIVLLAPDADEFGYDHRMYRRQIGLPEDIPSISERPAAPSVAEISRVCNEPARTAVVLVDVPGLDPTIGTRLAIRHQHLPIYAHNAAAGNPDDDVPSMGKLREYRLNLDLPQGEAHDLWERIARLIHNRYVGKATTPTAATKTWSDLDPFYRGSNRRQVVNALWIVEAIGHHTWNTAGDPPKESWRNLQALRQLEPIEQLNELGFDEPTALAMAAQEHKDWCAYYFDNGWQYGAVRDDNAKTHDGLVEWSAIETDPDRRRNALRSLASTLVSLRELGYRSRPIREVTWQAFRRRGTVIAAQRSEDWTWQSNNGETMTANPGDWEVRETEDGPSWSVRDDIFRTLYIADTAGRWARTGTVQARPAGRGETVHSLEGPVTSAEGDWVVKGPDGRCWPVSADMFARSYHLVGDDPN